jgi:hypothetical protein
MRWSMAAVAAGLIDFQPILQGAQYTSLLPESKISEMLHVKQS